MATPARPTGVSIVVPTIGRPSLQAVLTALAAGEPPGVATEVLIVDDRREHRTELPVPDALTAHTKVLTGPGRGPAAARNVGWRAARHDWVTFLDDDVVPAADWFDQLAGDLTVGGDVGGVQGRVVVPLPADRRPTDWERVTAGLADGLWITADMAYRRAALTAAGGFDERLPRAFREDADLAYRVRQAGWQLRQGRRQVTHPVRPESRWVSVRTQAGNADDALLRRMYGPQWRRLLDVPAGRRHRHAVVTGAALAAVACAALAAVDSAHRTGWRAAATTAGAVWLTGTARFATARIAPGPRTVDELATMAVTSAVIPPVAIAHWVRGWLRWRGAQPVVGGG